MEPSLKYGLENVSLSQTNEFIVDQIILKIYHHAFQNSFGTMGRFHITKLLSKWTCFFMKPSKIILKMEKCTRKMSYFEYKHCKI